MGVYSISAAMTQGFPVSSSASRTALGFLIRGHGPSCTPWWRWSEWCSSWSPRTACWPVPEGGLGALVVYAGLRLIDIPEFKRLYRFRPAPV